jgi:hypothetical protein
MLRLMMASILSLGRLATAGGQSGAAGSRPTDSLESIYAVRSWRESRCFLLLDNLSHGYLGGHLTANTINSRQVLGGTTDPEGYVQSSIATVRLWRRPPPP